MTPHARKAWLTVGGSVKDREMIRPTSTPPAHVRPLAWGGTSRASVWLGCALLLGVLACDSRAPKVQSEPASGVAAPTEPARVERAAVDVAPAAPTAPVSAEEPQVDLAKYEARPEGAAPAPSPAPAVATTPPARAAGGTKSPAPTSQGEPALGAVVSDDAFSTWLQAPAPAAVGATSYVEAVLVAKAPYHCNAEYPHKFKLGAPSPGVSYPEETVRGMQVAPERSVLRIPLEAANAGLAKVSGTLSFSVCTEERCLVEKRELTLDLQVK